MHLGVQANNFLFSGRVPANNFLYPGRVPANNFLFAGRVPANNLFLNIMQQGVPYAYFHKIMISVFLFLKRKPKFSYPQDLYPFF